MTDDALTDHATIVKDVYAAYERKDVAAVFRLLHPDVAVSQTERLPWGGEYRGIAAAGTFFQKLSIHLSSVVSVDEYVSAGDRVIAIGRTRGRVRSNDARFDVRAVHVWTVRDGRITAVDFHVDTPAMLAALEQAPTGD